MPRQAANQETLTVRELARSAGLTEEEFLHAVRHLYPIRQVEEHLSVEQLAERIGVSESTIWKAIAKTEIKPLVKLGHRLTRIPASAANRYLKSKTVTQ